MEKYQVICKAGSGNFSDVYKARNRLTDQIVAIKQMKHCEDLEQLTYKQLQILATLNHPNIIKVKQIIRQKDDVKVVFEYMDETLLELYQSSKYGINQNQIRCILFQSAFALDYLHKHRLIHRDIKPENLLINRKVALIKLIDFGLAKQQYLASTDYVATRWYRAPENLLGLRNSSTAMDIFALGCVIVELFTLNPLFPGDNTLDQLNKVINVLGTPTQDNWSEGFAEIQRKGIMLAEKTGTGLRSIMSNASSELVNLVEQMLHLNPLRRITARQILNHPFFLKVQRVIPENIYKQVQKSKQEYESKKARKISPIEANGNKGKYFSKNYLNSFNSAKKNDTSIDSRLSIQKQLRRNPSVTQMKDNNHNSIPANTINSPTKVSTNNFTHFHPSMGLKGLISAPLITEQRVRNTYSRDHMSFTPLSVQKRSHFNNTSNPNIPKMRILDNQRFNTTHETKQIKQQDPNPSPRYNHKYFKEPHFPQERRTLGISLQSPHLSKNIPYGNNFYISNNINGYRKQR